jgi:hypothetical protein
MLARLRASASASASARARRRPKSEGRQRCAPATREPAVLLLRKYLPSGKLAGAANRRSVFFSMALRQTCQLVCSILLIVRNHQASNFSRNRSHFFNQTTRTTLMTPDPSFHSEFIRRSDGHLHWLHCLYCTARSNIVSPLVVFNLRLNLAPRISRALLSVVPNY